jgi:ankyrin repeat protein
MSRRHSCVATALSSALKAGYQDAAQALIDAGAATTGLDANNRTALMHAAAGGCADIVEALLAGPAAAGVNAMDEDRFTALSMASDPAIVRLLLDAQADVSRTSVESALFGSCRRFQAESVRMLLEAKAPVDLPGPCSPLASTICAHGPTDEINKKVVVLSLLLDAGANTRDISSKSSALHLCVSATAPDTVDTAAFLLDRDPGLLVVRNAQGETALMLAARTLNVEMVKFFISRGADVNACDSTKQSVLANTMAYPSLQRSIASTLKLREVVQLLLLAGADPAQCGDGHMTPVMWVVVEPEAQSAYKRVADVAFISDIADAILARGSG